MNERGIVRNRAIVMNCVFEQREGWKQVDIEYREKKWELVRIGFMCKQTYIFFYMVKHNEFV